MQEIILDAEIRQRTGKHAKSLRSQGKVPGIFYLHGEENIPITVVEKSLRPLLHSAETHIINLKLSDGNGKSCILRDVQFDPLTDNPIHFDLQGLRENEEITLDVPIILTGGIPVGVREGGILQQVIHQVKVSCLPKFIPQHFEVNVENLKINSFIHVSDLIIENVTIIENPTSSIVGVVPPTIEKEPEPGVPAVEEAVEPEVIGKGKKPEEGAEAEEGAEKKAEPAKAPAAPKEEKK